MSNSQTRYQAFLLRVRRTDNLGCPVWRISLERPGRPGQVQLESLSALCAYLEAQMQTTEGKGGAATNNDSSAPDRSV